ncbi:MAG: NUDIX domain-containing protein, partial [Candidatus Aenigmatarchaeota archaeon]
PEDLAGYVKNHGRLPEYDSQNNRGLQKILGSLAKPLVSVGGVIVDAELLDRPDPDVLLMRSPDWTDRYTVVGERIKSGQGLSEALESTIHEKTGLTPKLGKHIITFDEQSDDPDSKGRIFVDHAVLVRGNLRPERTTGCRYGWVSLSAALGEIDLEPNARRTLELYASSLDRI